MFLLSSDISGTVNGLRKDFGLGIIAHVTTVVVNLFLISSAISYRENNLREVCILGIAISTTTGLVVPWFLLPTDISSMENVLSRNYISGYFPSIPSEQVVDLILLLPDN